MKRSILIILFTIGIFLSYSQSHYFKFKVEDKNEIKSITTLISIDNLKDQTVWAYANDKEFENFLKLGIDYEELPLYTKSSKAITMATTVAEMANWDRYPTYDVYIEMMNKFETDYPALCKVVSIGTSVNGRELKAVKISDNVSIHEAEPEFFYTGTIHGDETTGFVLLLRLIDHLLTNYGSDPQITDLINNIEIYINPSSNPDGTYAGGNDIISGTRNNANGIDLNRNYPDPRAGDHPDGYVWQDETIAMMNFAESNHFVMSANYHGGIELANYPWDTWNSSQNLHADNNWWYHVSRNYADSCQNNSPPGYFDDYGGVTEGGDWYIITGGRQDYMNYFNHCREVTFEISTDKTVSSDTLPHFWDFNKQAFLDYIEEVTYGFYGTVKNSSGDPLDAKVEIISHDIDNSWVTTDPINGDYYRPIEPGTYSVTYSSYGYIPQNVDITITDWKTSTLQNIILLEQEQTTVSGNITEKGTSNSLSNAKIEILNTPFLPVYSETNGDYSFSDVYIGNYEIKASKTGYIQEIQLVDISGSNNVFNFELEKSDAENFEIEIPNDFDFAGVALWNRVSDFAYNGEYSMRSGNISDSQSSVMSVEKNILTVGDISFYKKVSSEQNWDFLKFYIDDNMLGQWSGEIDWSEEIFPVTEGIHNFKWEYIKDGAISHNEDAAWIDFIDFPIYDTVDISNPDEFQILIFPNPGVGELTIKSSKIIDQIIVTDITGKLIDNFLINNIDTKITINNQGIFLLQIRSGTKIVHKKIIIR